MLSKKKQKERHFIDGLHYLLVLYVSTKGDKRSVLKTFWLSIWLSQFPQSRKASTKKSLSFFLLSLGNIEQERKGKALWLNKEIKGIFLIFAHLSHFEFSMVVNK